MLHEARNERVRASDRDVVDATHDFLPATPLDPRYLEWLAARRASQAAANTNAQASTSKLERKEARAAAAAERQTKLAQRRPLLKEIDGLELNLAQWHEEKREIDETLADPSIYESPDPDHLKGLALRQNELTRLIDEAEQRWLEVHEELEGIGEVQKA